MFIMVDLCQQCLSLVGHGSLWTWLTMVDYGWLSSHCDVRYGLCFITTLGYVSHTMIMSYIHHIGMLGNVHHIVMFLNGYVGLHHTATSRVMLDRDVWKGIN
jgi:hypothetical protein